MLLFIGCSKDEENPAEPQNTAPVITNITPTPHPDSNTSVNCKLKVSHPGTRFSIIRPAHFFNNLPSDPVTFPTCLRNIGVLHRHTCEPRQFVPTDSVYQWPILSLPSREALWGRLNLQRAVMSGGWSMKKFYLPDCQTVSHASALRTLSLRQIKKGTPPNNIVIRDKLKAGFRKPKIGNHRRRCFPIFCPELKARLANRRYDVTLEDKPSWRASIAAIHNL